MEQQLLKMKNPTESNEGYILDGNESATSSKEADEIRECDINLSGSETVELDGRYNSEMRIIAEDTILTVSLDDGTNLEILPSGFERQRRRKSLCSCTDIDTGSPILPIFCSFVVLVICIIFSELYKDKKLNKSGKVILMVTRSMGIYSFFGGVVTLLSIKLVFSLKCIWICNRCISTDQQLILFYLKRFITGVVFEEMFMKQYVRRIVAVKDTDSSKMTLDLMEGELMDKFVSDKLECFLSTPEGFMLDSLNIDKDKLQSYVKRTLSEVICDLYPLIFNKISCDGLLRPESMKRHVDVMVSERLNSLGYIQLNKLVKDLVKKRFNRVITLSTFLSAIIGCLIELLHIYVFVRWT